METLTQYGSMQESEQFHPGMNFVTVDGPVCISYVSMEGEQLCEFILKEGSHHVRVPTRVKVFVECHDTVNWHVRKYDPHEHPDETPVEVTVVRPMSLKDEMRQQVADIVARHLGLRKEQLETPEDMEDFDTGDEGDDIPATFSELRTMAIDEQAEARAKVKMPSATVDNPVSPTPDPEDPPAQ